MPKFTIVVAVSKNNVIGKDNKLPWPMIKEDMIHFKKTTSGQAILMGRKTFESIGKPLPNRKNYVLTSQEIVNPNIILVKNIEEVKKLPEEEIFIIGGQSIYEQFLPLANKIIISRLPFEIKGDSFFPVVDKKEWMTIKNEIINLSMFDNQAMLVETLVRSMSDIL